MGNPPTNDSDRRLNVILKAMCGRNERNWTDLEQAVRIDDLQGHVLAKLPFNEGQRVKLWKHFDLGDKVREGKADIFGQPMTLGVPSAPLLFLKGDEDQAARVKSILDAAHPHTDLTKILGSLLPQEFPKHDDARGFFQGEVSISYMGLGVLLEDCAQAGVRVTAAEMFAPDWKLGKPAKSAPTTKQPAAAQGQPQAATQPKDGEDEVHLPTLDADKAIYDALQSGKLVEKAGRIEAPRLFAKLKEELGDNAIQSLAQSLATPKLNPAGKALNMLVMAVDSCFRHGSATADFLALVLTASGYDLDELLPDGPATDEDEDAEAEAPEPETEATADTDEDEADEDEVVEATAPLPAAEPEPQPEPQSVTAPVASVTAPAQENTVPNSALQATVAQVAALATTEGQIRQAVADGRLKLEVNHHGESIVSTGLAAVFVARMKVAEKSFKLVGNLTGKLLGRGGDAVSQSLLSWSKVDRVKVETLAAALVAMDWTLEDLLGKAPAVTAAPSPSVTAPAKPLAGAHKTFDTLVLEVKDAMAGLRLQTRLSVKLGVAIIDDARLVKALKPRVGAGKDFTISRIAKAASPLVGKAQPQLTSDYYRMLNEGQCHAPQLAALLLVTGWTLGELLGETLAVAPAAQPAAGTTPPTPPAEDALTTEQREALQEAEAHIRALVADGRLELKTDEYGELVCHERLGMAFRAKMVTLGAHIDDVSTKVAALGIEESVVKRAFTKWPQRGHVRLNVLAGVMVAMGWTLGDLVPELAVDEVVRPEAEPLTPDPETHHEPVTADVAAAEPQGTDPAPAVEAQAPAPEPTAEPAAPQPEPQAAAAPVAEVLPATQPQAAQSPFSFTAEGILPPIKLSVRQQQTLGLVFDSLAERADKGDLMRKILETLPLPPEVLFQAIALHALNDSENPNLMLANLLRMTNEPAAEKPAEAA